MDAQASTKIRLVRCPRCWKVLEELQDVSLYRCGGCGNILQAKKRNLESNHAESNTAKSQEVDISEAKEAGSSVSNKRNPTLNTLIVQHVSTGPPSLESSPDKDGSLEVTPSNVEDKESLKQGNLEGQVSEGCNCEIDDNAEWTGGSSSGIPSSGEFTKSIELVEQQERDDFADAVRDLPTLEDPVSISPSGDPLENSEKGRVFTSYPKQDSERGAVVDRVDFSPGFVSQENNDVASPIVTSLEKDRNLVVHDSTVTSQRSLAESLETSYLTCPEDEQSVREGTHIFEKPSRPSGRTSESDLKQRLITNHPTDRAYYRHGSIASSYNGTVNREPNRNYHARFSHGPMKSSSQWDQEKYAQTTGYASEINTRRDKNLLPPRPRFSSSSKASYSEMDKVELLRTVHELKDQLSRIQFPKVLTNRRLPDRSLNGKFNSFNYDHLSGCTGKYDMLRMSFSGEDFMRSCPRERRYSAQFPVARSQCPGSELSLSGYETKSDEVNKRLHLQGKRRVGMRHVRPTAGAAPFLACYHCSKLLHLPADFLIFEKRRCHQLMCSACKKVLKFAIVQGRRIIPYVPDTSSAPPPSEADEYSRNLVASRSFSMQGEALEKNGGSMVGSSSRIPKWRKSTSDVREDHRLHHLMGYSSPSQVFD